MAKVAAVINQNEFLVQITKGELNLLAGWARYKGRKEWAVGDGFDIAEMYSQLENIVKNRSAIHHTVEELRAVADTLEKMELPQVIFKPKES